MRSRHLTVFVFAACLVLLMTSQGFCDVSPGDVIDKTNWEKAEGLLPESMLNWLKNGKVVLEIGELSYNPEEYHPPFALESLKTNIGKYALDEHDGIVDATTGKRPRNIIGFPFPEIDPNDPKAGTKILYNKDYVHYRTLHKPFRLFAINEGSDAQHGDGWKPEVRGKTQSGSC